MVHYIYKITFLVGSLSEHYYIGKRSYKGNDITCDVYCGSGKICDDYFKTHKKILNETYKKDILKICNSEKEAYDEEEKILGNLFETDEMCVNIKRGGYGGFATKEPWNKGKKGCQVAWNKGVKNLTHKGKAIVQLTLNDEKIKEYEKIKDAAKEYGINERFISKCCRGIISEYKGYKWRFKDER